MISILRMIHVTVFLGVLYAAHLSAQDTLGSVEIVAVNFAYRYEFEKTMEWILSNPTLARHTIHVANILQSIQQRINELSNRSTEVTDTDEPCMICILRWSSGIVDTMHVTRDVLLFRGKWRPLDVSLLWLLSIGLPRSYQNAIADEIYWRTRQE